jgi:hypothetical protein
MQPKAVLGAGLSKTQRCLKMRRSWVAQAVSSQGGGGSWLFACSAVRPAVPAAPCRAIASPPPCNVTPRRARHRRPPIPAPPQVCGAPLPGLPQQRLRAAQDARGVLGRRRDVHRLGGDHGQAWLHGSYALEGLVCSMPGEFDFFCARFWPLHAQTRAAGVPPAWPSGHVCRRSALAPLMPRYQLLHRCVAGHKLASSEPLPTAAAFTSLAGGEQRPAATLQGGRGGAHPGS